jgi:hypothetical protein
MPRSIPSGILGFGSSLTELGSPSDETVKLVFDEPPTLVVL